MAFLLLRRVTLSNKGLLSNIIANAAVGRYVTVGGRRLIGSLVNVTEDTMLTRL
jgi:hypothetical protein